MIIILIRDRLSAAQRPATLRVEVARRRGAIASIAATLGVTEPDTERTSDPSAFVEWATRIAEDLAEGSGPPFRTPVRPLSAS